MKTTYSEAKPYITKDGTIIRELLHPKLHSINNSSIAEAIVEVGFESHLHHHLKNEEIYHITQGKGILTLGNNTLAITEGDSIAIAPKTAHKSQRPRGKPTRHLVEKKYYSQQATGN